MAETQKRMDEAQQKGQEQYAAMKLRIKYMYETGDSSFLEMLCSAESLTDFLNKSEFIQDVSEYDRNMLQELQNTQEEIRKEGDELQAQQTSLENLQQELTTKRSTLESKISSTSSELTKYQAQLERAKAAEQLLAQQAAAQQAQQQQTAQQTAQGVTQVVVPETPSTDGSTGGDVTVDTPSTDGLGRGTGGIYAAPTEKRVGCDDRLRRPPPWFLSVRFQRERTARQGTHPRPRREIHH